MSLTPDDGVLPISPRPPRSVPPLADDVEAASYPMMPGGPVPEWEVRALERPALTDSTWTRLADGWARWRDDPRAAAVAILVVALACAVFWYRSALGGPSASAALPGASAVSADATATTSATPTTPAAGADLVVHVSGAVASPGVYRLPPGSRTADAIARAGGTQPDGDPDRLNLAAPLADGQRVHVPRAGEPMPDGVTTSGIDSAVPGLVNLNLASLDQLESLPGVGPATARAIVEERERRGGFRSVDELLSVRGIGEAKLADLRPHVTV